MNTRTSSFELSNFNCSSFCSTVRILPVRLLISSLKNVALSVSVLDCCFWTSYLVSICTRLFFFVSSASIFRLNVTVLSPEPGRPGLDQQPLTDLLAPDAPEIVVIRCQVG